MAQQVKSSSVIDAHNSLSDILIHLCSRGILGRALLVDARGSLIRTLNQPEGLSECRQPSFDDRPHLRGSRLLRSGLRKDASDRSREVVLCNLQ